MCSDQRRLGITCNILSWIEAYWFVPTRHCRCIAITTCLVSDSRQVIPRYAPCLQSHSVQMELRDSFSRHFTSIARPETLILLSNLHPYSSGRNSSSLSSVSSVSESPWRRYVWMLHLSPYNRPYSWTSCCFSRFHRLMKHLFVVLANAAMGWPGNLSSLSTYQYAFVRCEATASSL